VGSGEWEWGGVRGGGVEWSGVRGWSIEWSGVERSRVEWRVERAAYTTHCTLYTVHCTLYTIHHTPYTIHHTRCTSTARDGNIRGLRGVVLGEFEPAFLRRRALVIKVLVSTVYTDYTWLTVLEPTFTWR
jgi:hypothetical protein